MSTLTKNGLRSTDLSCGCFLKWAYTRLRRATREHECIGNCNLPIFPGERYVDGSMVETMPYLRYCVPCAHKLGELVDDTHLEHPEHAT